MNVATWVQVPADTQAAQCRSCHATIYWVRTFSGRRMPVDCDVDGGARPTAAEHDEGAPGRGVSHFATCRDAAQWRTRVRA